jgi:hypothetical protein
MITKMVEVTHMVAVTLDETKFDDAFMREFRDCMYPFNTIEEHMKHLAIMYSRGHISFGHPLIEGYGYMNEMGIRLGTGDITAHIDN